MRSFAGLASVAICIGLLLLAGPAAAQTGSGSFASAPPPQPGTARVWVLRQPNSPYGNIEGADPMVYANGSPIAQSAPAHRVTAID